MLVIDDGSTDRTRVVARNNGVHHLIRLRGHFGLASAFQAGLDACLKLGADVVVNLDADGQFSGADIPRLIAPILAGDADTVIGDRGVGSVAHFSRVKRLLQRIGSAVVSRASSARIPDATSGFRAYSREGAIRVYVLSRFTYTLETIVQAGRGGAAIVSVPVITVPSPRASRLFPSTRIYLWRTVPALFRTYAGHEPLQFFLRGALTRYVVAALAWGHFAYTVLLGPGPPGEVSSLAIGTVLVVVGTQLGAVGVIGDVVGAWRDLDADVQRRLRVLELVLGVGPSHHEVGVTERSESAPVEEGHAPARALESSRS